MFVKFVSGGMVTEHTGKPTTGDPGWELDLEDALLECEDVLWNRMRVKTEPDLLSAIQALLCCSNPDFEVFGTYPDEWSARGEGFVFLRLMNNGNTRPILVSERSVYLMNDQGKTIERIC